MPLIHLADVPEHEQRSPSGKFHSFVRRISAALGAPRDIGLWGGGHPFDLVQRRLPPGAIVCPLHAHLATWELFVVERGEGTVRPRTDDGEARHAVRPGDAFIQPPGQAHQLINTGATDLVVWIIADNPPLDACFYPDSGKWCLDPGPDPFRGTAFDYFADEDPAADAASHGPVTFPAAPGLPLAGGARFAKVHRDDVKWDDWGSPGGKFHARGKSLSLALGAKEKTPPGLGGHPFDLEWQQLQPGEIGCPFHAHHVQWELFVILRGRARVRAADTVHELEPGAIILHPPGEAHSITSIGDEPLEFYLLADNPSLDVCSYPDSGKWSSTIPGPTKVHRQTAADYWDGEE